MAKAKVRGVGTGSNMLRTLMEYMMFDTDGSGGIEIEEVQQMFFIYYGYWISQSKYPDFCLFYYYMAPSAPKIHTNTVLMAPEAPEIQSNTRKIH